ncbi:C-C motif chemokine 22-like [Melanotaenia boesemani]|uniref:C-C motif chemokine 22-like n=1 Tax=Melanotaenia boesemani TaxID=1250792 RepID=UPI001C053B98|nr:C-C motif chemokine 22-like [Melanotaenia boesemani]
MKTLVILGLLTFICLLGGSSAGPLGPQLMFREGCCNTFKRIPVPRDRVKHVATSPSDCRHKAIIITAVSGRKFCTDPTWSWATKLLEDFQKPSHPSNTEVPELHRNQTRNLP